MFLISWHQEVVQNFFTDSITSYLFSFVMLFPFLFGHAKKRSRLSAFSFVHYFSAHESMMLSTSSMALEN